ncbi:histidinol-phosphate transaminase [Streptomyces sp. NBC_01537]|uniref:histidinol-phosphate transaminase n=1 Tax=Streptomyces sp. NBC_01537 TaxID=2903896 RepID=UPI00386BF466
MHSLHARPALGKAVAGLPPYVAGRRAQNALTAALASNESHYEPLPSVLESVRSTALLMNRYPDTASTELRQRLAEHLAVTADELAVGPGSVGVLQQIITSFCDPGDEVVFAWRSFEAYPILTALAGARPVPVPLLPDENHDLDAMAAAITGHTRVILLCTPNNPTGTPIASRALQAFLTRVPADVLVVIDEAYVEYATGPDPVDSLALYRRHPNVCVLRTFSKAYGLAGLRVGYAVAAPELADGLRRAALPFAVSALAQRAAVASLDAAHEMAERVHGVVAERERLLAALRAQGWQVPDSRANFLWLRTDAALHSELLHAFTTADTLVRSNAGDGIRVSLADAATNDRVLNILGDRTAFG